jgi:hypothetical protein
MQCNAMKLCKRIEFWLHSLLTLVWDGGKWLPHAMADWPPEKSPGTHWIRDWVNPTAGLYISYKGYISCHYWDSILDCPASSLVTIPTVLPTHSFYCCSKHFNKSWNLLFAVTLPTIWCHLERLWFCACLTQTMGILCAHSEHILLGRSQTRNHVRQGMTPGKWK